MIIKTELQKLAQSIVKRADDPKTSFAEAVDALKALTNLYATLLKDKGKFEDDSDGFTMADAQATIEESGHGEAAMGSHRRRRAQ